MSDEELLTSDSDPAETFSVFYERHVRPVLAYLASRGIDPQLAADVTAETFAAALISRHRFRGSDERARSWLLGIATNKMSDSKRRWHRDRRLLARLQIEVATTTSDVADFVHLKEHGHLQLLDELPDAQRDCVRARVLEERSYEEIAERHAVSEATARQRVSRGLAHLRQRLEVGP